MHQTFDACAFMLGAQRFDQLTSCRANLLYRFFRQGCLLNQRGYAFCFRPTVGIGDCLAQGRLLADRRREILENRSGSGYLISHGAMLAKTGSGPVQLCFYVGAHYHQRKLHSAFI